MPSLSRSADAIASDDRPSTDATPAASSTNISRTEWIIVALALAMLCALRWFSVYSHRWNSDEPQHLHVVWAWTVGQLQYRDIFDNHTPLFHILNAPLLRWLGERADIILCMRRAMIPLFAIGVWCVYRLGAVVYDRRTGCFAALIAAFLPLFFFLMGEFRTDVLWTAVWLAALAVVLSGKLTPRRTFCTALLLGTAFGVSMKTTLLLLCMATAGAITWLLSGRPVSKTWPRHAVAFVAGLLIVPGAIVGYFAGQGALAPLYHCVIAHNTMPGQNLGKLIGKQIVSTTTLWLIPIGFLTRAMLPSVRQDPIRGYRRLFLFLVTGLYYSLLHAFWPVITMQDYMPWAPLVPIFAVAGMTWAVERLQSRFNIALPWLLAPSLVLMGEITWILKVEPVFTANEDKRVAGMAQFLRLSKRGEYVFDLKGESIFRPRPTYLAFESLTREQVKNGRLKDDTIENLIAKHVPVVRLTDRMMPETQRFIEQNYVRLTGGRALGKRLQTVRDTPCAFEISIPETYAFVGTKGPVSGTIDGQSINGPVRLEAGRHELVVTNHMGETSVIWAPALERGFSPYIKLDSQVQE